ncbi:MAG: DUF4388 domain-containing protein [Thermomicrobium sp.]|nr:DUF4388 domain-containing protein [Thermomicrobium sp.]MDW7982929.1 DUF4388 domain-containing protein [Thermomicrobium sp.]
MPIYGDLADLPLHLLLQALIRAGQTGRLVLRTRVEEVTLVLDRGRLAAVSSSDTQLRIGQRLLQLGEISEEQLEQALALQTVVPGRRLGRLLVELGFVTHQQVKRALASQFEEALVRLLTAPDATFAFDPEPALVPDDESVLDDAPVTKLILNAIRRADEATTPIEVVSRVPERSLLDRLAPEEREVLIALLEGGRTVRHVAQMTGLGEEVVVGIVGRLRTLGLVR